MTTEYIKLPLPKTLKPWNHPEYWKGVRVGICEICEEKHVLKNDICSFCEDIENPRENI